MNKNTHAGHRERVRRRFLSEGSLDSFEYHQVLEFLLFFAIARRDTNALAHRMIDEFGSFDALLEASPKEIMNRCRVSESVAVLISIIPYITKRYIESAVNTVPDVIRTTADAKHLSSKFVYERPDGSYMLCLTNGKAIINCVRIKSLSEYISDGFDDLVQDALIYRSVHIVFIQKRPNVKPLEEEINFTKKAVNIFFKVNIRVMDHIIVGNDEVFSFAENNLCKLNPNKYNAC